MIVHVTTVNRPLIGILPPSRRRSYKHQSSTIATSHKFSFASLFHILQKPNSHIVQRNVQTQAIPTDFETISYYVGKSVIMFTMFYCSLNWLHYRRLREEEEKSNKKK